MYVCTYIFDIKLEGMFLGDMEVLEKEISEGYVQISLYTRIKFPNIMEKSKAKYNYSQI